MKPAKKITAKKLKLSAKLTKKAAAAAAARAKKRQRWAIGGTVALAVAIAWFVLLPAGKERPPVPPRSPAAETGGPRSPQTPAPIAAPVADVPEKPLAFIRAVRLHPSEPTRLDSLKAEVEAAPDAPRGLTYTYLWKVNDRVVKEAKGDTLPLTNFKKRDLVTVTVTPHDGETAGFAVHSPVVAIQYLPPSLEFKVPHQTKKAGDPIELQLIGTAPDGTIVGFSLADPLLPGMTIDQRSGVITWRRQPGQKGTLSFGAAVEDDNRSRVTKVFSVTIE